MSKYLIGLVLTIFTSLSWGLTLDELATRLAKQPLVRADFKQTKQIKGLSKPLQSSGKMIFARDKGLYWHQQHPFDLVLVLTESTMIQIVNNQDKQVITAESNPQMFQFNHLLTAIFKADKSVLEKSFTTELTQDQGKAWVLTLYPTVSPLDKIFNVITLSGHKYVEQVVLDDKQGDKTNIEFLNQTTQPALNAAELNYFVP